MSKTKSLFITTIYNLKIQEDLNDGIEIWNKIKITNNKKIINNLITDSLVNLIGTLEANALRDADAIFYAIDYHEIDNKNDDDILCNYLGNCKIFLNDLWNIKDNCADLMMGYIEYPYKDVNNFIALPYTKTFAHSNFVTGGYTDAGGNHNISIEFSKKEIEDAKFFNEGDNRTLLPFSETSKKTTLLEKEMPRITISSTLIQTARMQNDLGLKISHYCTALEALFTNDIAELAHKLSERVAYFLESEPEKRKEIFKQTKDIYSIRSQVMHGSAITKKYKNLEVISKKADEILRRVFMKLFKTPELDQYFRKPKSDGLEEYMTNLVLGIDNAR